MPCSVQVGANGSVAISGGGIAVSTSSDGGPPLVAIGFPCSCSCTRSQPYVMIGGAQPTQQAPPSATTYVPPTAVTVAIAAPIYELPLPPREDNDILAFGLLLVFGACAALLVIYGLLPPYRATRAAGQSTIASSPVLTIQAQAQQAVDHLSTLHLSIVEHLLRRSRP